LNPKGLCAGPGGVSIQTPINGVNLAGLLWQVEGCARNSAENQETFFPEKAIPSVFKRKEGKRCKEGNEGKGVQEEKSRPSRGGGLPGKKKNPSSFGPAQSFPSVGPWEVLGGMGKEGRRRSVCGGRKASGGGGRRGGLSERNQVAPRGRRAEGNHISLKKGFFIALNLPKKKVNPKPYPQCPL